jgi:hypothetical protein
VSEFFASRKCPACAASIGRVRLDHARSGVKWYRLAPRTFRCPTCLTAVAPLTRPAGYALQTLIVVLALGLQLVVIWPGVGTEQFVLVCAGGGVSILLLAVVCSRFGFDYRLPSATAPPGPLKPAQERDKPNEAS